MKFWKKPEPSREWNPRTQGLEVSTLTTSTTDRQEPTPK